jgi:hypothetical protein
VSHRRGGGKGHGGVSPERGRKGRFRLKIRGGGGAPVTRLGQRVGGRVR